nr:MAG TPA: hypothetical protein [Bacteriophage sp.]
MNIISKLGVKLETIKGWELVGTKVEQEVAITLNQIQTKMYLTEKGFYLYLNNIWYNGDRKTKGRPDFDVDSILAKNKDFTTARPVTVTEPNLVAAGTRLKPIKAVSAFEEITPDMKDDEDQIKQLESEKVVKEPTLTRIFKKEAREAYSNGKIVYLCKVNKKKSLDPNETLTKVEGEFDEAFNLFLRNANATKDNTIYFVEE